MIAIIDYGMGNLRSVQKAFEYLGFPAEITDEESRLDNASHIVLPGVGAIADAVKKLREKNLDEAIRRQVRSGKPFLGICLGMQLLFETSRENGTHDCLGLVEGEVRPFALDGTVLKVPHMGWNSITVRDRALFDEAAGRYVYFVHSYHATGVPEQWIAAECRYGYDFVCAVRKENVFGVQFHPEKSGETGLAMLKRFGGLK